MSNEPTPTPDAGVRRRATQTRSSRWPLGLERLPSAVRWTVVALVGLLSLAALVVVVDVAVSAGRIHPGVYVGDIPVGGMNVDEATTKIASEVATRAAQPVTIQADGLTWDVQASDVAFSMDATAHAQQAYEVGRGDFRSTVLERLQSFVGGGTVVSIEPTCNAEAMDVVLATVSDGVATPAVDAGVVVKGTSVERTEPADGLDIDREQAQERLLAAFVSTSREVPLELVTVKPAINAERAEGAYQDALKMVSGPMTLYWEDKEWEVAADTIGEGLGFRPTEAGDTLEAYLISSEVSATVLPMVAQVGKPAKNASFKASEGKVSIVPSVDGLAADAEDLASKLMVALTGTGERRAELTMHRVEPDITTEDAKGMGIVERISTFTTTYSTSNKPRNNNIHVLADDLDGVLVAPGAVFDLNKTAGPSTAEKGYMPAGAIVDGQIESELGGGICQVATTMFNTVFFSGSPVVERHNHSLYISAYPTGRDAAISIGGPNLRFKNDTAHWILVATSYTASSVTISLYGTDPGYTVSYETGPWTNLKSPPVREIKDPKLPQGSRVIKEHGASGRTIVVTRTVTKGGTVVRTDSFKSVYKPVEQVVRVGTKPVSSTPTTTTP